VKRICIEKETQLVFHRTVGMSKDNSCHTTVQFDISVAKIPVLYDTYITTAYC
jgi:hypothetical protein